MDGDYNNEFQYENKQDLNYNDDQYDEDDLYLQELHSRLIQMKQERKEAQKNAQLLDNRLNKLKNEEEKNWKKIQNKKKQKNEKLIYLKNVVDNIKQIENAKLKKEKQIEEQKQLNKKLKNDIKNGIEKNKLEKQKQINDDAKLLKLQKQYNEQLIAFLDNEKKNNNKSKCEYIKSQQLIEKEKKKKLERERKIKLKEKLEKQLLEEYKLKEEADAKKIKAEQEENEVLKRLKTTTQINKDISEELERINLNNIMKGEYSSNYNYNSKF